MPVARLLTIIDVPVSKADPATAETLEWPGLSSSDQACEHGAVQAGKVLQRLVIAGLLAWLPLLVCLFALMS